MFSIKHIFFSLLGVNVLFIVIFFTNVKTPQYAYTETNTQAFTTPGTRQTSETFVTTETFVVPVDDKIPEDKSDGKDEKSDDDDDVDDEPAMISHSYQNLQPYTQIDDEPVEIVDDNIQPENPKAKNDDMTLISHKDLEKIKYIVDGLKEHLGLAQDKVDSLIERRDKVQHVLRWSNPFFLLGAYPKVGLEYFNSYPDGRPFYDDYNYGLINDPDYCEIVDFYNLAHPENMFEQKNFFTDYAKNGLARSEVIRKIGVDTMRQVSRYMSKEEFNSAQYHMNPTITNFFTKRVDLHIYHTIGKHFNCATQMYNHIPGHGVLKRKDLIVNSVDSYAQRFENRPHCFNKKKFFPYSYRLYLQEECQAFFEEINSEKYIKSLEQEPIQYVIKLGYGAHRAMGVFILDEEQTENIKTLYDNGELCGIETKSRIAQTYITNPLLLNFNNKFDFRVYMLIASTNPLIVYYHDGFLRVSLHTYDKFSNEKSVHLTNTHLAKDTFAEAAEQNKTFNGMNEQELRDYQMWTFERLGNYLYESGKVQDPDYIEKSLKPSFYEAFIHTVRMSAHAFWNQSNVYEMFGLDFMLDEDLNLWFIECNSSPQLIGTNEYKTKFLITMLEDLFEIQYNLYRSRMKRVLLVLRKINLETIETGKANYVPFRDDYAEAVKNRFEPEYEVSEANSFKLIMDLNLKGKDAYFGNLDSDCVDD